MINEDFDKIVQNRLNVCKEVLLAKSDEYSSSTDRLHNFKAAGMKAGVSPEAALIGMKLKHDVSIDDIVMFCSRIHPGNAHNATNSELHNRVVEKITDSINYLLLLEALLAERYGWVEENLPCGFFDLGEDKS